MTGIALAALAAGCTLLAFPYNRTASDEVQASGEAESTVRAYPMPNLPRAGAIRVPAGFRAEVYAARLGKPTAMAHGPDGRLYVSQLDGRIVVVPPNGPPRLFARGFESPLGLAWRGRTLYVSSRGRLSAVDLNGRGRAVRRRTVVAGLPVGLHQQNNVVLGPDDRLYIGSGSTCNACDEKDARSASILSVLPDGTDLQVFATGLRNPFGLAFGPGTDRLYASINGRGGLGDWNPAETVVAVEEDANYGWPGCWPDYRSERLRGTCAGVTRPLVYLEPHTSADGLVFWRSDLFVAEWGTFLSARGRKIIRVNTKTREARDFASGFAHPLALTVDPHGALLVADFGGARSGPGAIYRIQASRAP